MNARIVELDGSVHQRVQKLLPWAVLRQLPETEQKLVEDHAQSCAECRDDLEWQRRLQCVQPAAGAAPNLDSALERLMPRMAPQVRPARGQWMRWALAAQLLVIGALGSTLVLREQPAYRLLGNGAGAASANLVVVFKPEASERQLRTLLQAQAAKVVGGPTVANAWLLNVPAARLDGAVAAMRADAAVELAEPLPAEAP